MCGRIKKFNSDIRVGDSTNFISKKGNVTNGRFGIESIIGPPMYNARVETFRNTFKSYINNRGILVVDGFYEDDVYFTYGGDKKISIPILYNENYDFLILTRTAKPPVLAVHDRMPMIIGDYKDWLDNTHFTSDMESKLIKII